MSSTLDKIKAMFGNNSSSDMDMFNNMFRSNIIDDDLEQIKKDLAQLSSSGSSHMIPGLGQASQTIPSFGQAFQGLNIPLPQVLTAAEEAELKDLEVQERLDQRKAKLDIFKGLPREYCQSIINVLLWEDAVKDMNGVNIPEPSRLKELRLKRSMGGNFFGGYTQSPLPYLGGMPPGFPGQPWDDHATLRTSLVLPQGITTADLLEAHMDASLEEEIQGE